MLVQMHNVVIETLGEEKFTILQSNYGILLEYQPWKLYKTLYQNYVKPKDYVAVSKAMNVKINIKWDLTTPFGTFLCQQQFYKIVME